MMTPDELAFHLRHSRLLTVIDHSGEKFAREEAERRTPDREEE
jgi:hypothetical protein